MDPMDELRVPKRQVAIDVQHLGGSRRKFALFLSEFAAGHVGAERVSDVLNEAERFLPALDVELGAIKLLSRANIAIVWTSLDSEGMSPLPAEPPSADALVGPEAGAQAASPTPPGGNAFDLEGSSAPLVLEETRHPVTLALTDGTRLSGLLSYARPVEKARDIDFLNESGDFFPVRDGDRVALVNKRHVYEIAVSGR